MIIAIDGPAGSGKSSVALEVSKKLNLVYLDTGSMYRLITYFMINNGMLAKLDSMSDEEISKVLAKINFTLKDNTFLLDKEDVGNKIRTPEINQNISKVAQNKEIRKFLVNIQRKLGEEQDSILDGRDIGTVVFPNADFKFFLDASPEVRAQRRTIENEKKKITSTYDEILEEIIKRDEADRTRKIAPLSKAVDAFEIDTSNMTFEEVVNKVIEKVKNEA